MVFQGHQKVIGGRLIGGLRHSSSSKLGRISPRDYSGRLFSLNATGDFDLKKSAVPNYKNILSKGLLNSKQVLKRQGKFWPILKPPRSQTLPETAFQSGCLVLSYRRFASGVGFGRPVWRPRLILSSVRRRCWFWTLSKLDLRKRFDS